MVITMTNDKVTVIDITEQQYEAALLNNSLSEYNDKIIYECDKLRYVPIKMQIKLSSYDSNISSYYYDNGKKMVKKMVDSILSIKYYEDEKHNLWPSEEFYLNKQNALSIDYSKSELIELDSKLNRCDHIKNLISSKKYEDFLRLYNSIEYREKKRNQFNYEMSFDLISRFHNIKTKGKLIVRKNNKKLTANQLVGCIYYMAAPAGLTENNELKYFYKKYEITKLDVDEINKIFRRLLRNNKQKAAELSDIDRYNYLNNAVREYVQKLYSDMNFLGTKKNNIISDDTKTWMLLKSLFLKECGFTLPDYNDTWQDFNEIIIDDRIYDNGVITPLVIESQKKDSGRLIDREQPRFFSREVIAELTPHPRRYITLPLDEGVYPIDEDTAGDLKLLDEDEFMSSINAFERSDSASIDEYTDDVDIQDIKTDGEVGNMDNKLVNDEEMHEIFATEDLFAGEIDSDINVQPKVDDGVPKSEDVSDLFAGEIDANLTVDMLDDMLDGELDEDFLTDATPSLAARANFSNLIDSTAGLFTDEIDSEINVQPKTSDSKIESEDVSDLFAGEIDADITSVNLEDMLDENLDNDTSSDVQEDEIDTDIKVSDNGQTKVDFSDLFSDEIDEDQDVLDREVALQDLFKESEEDVIEKIKREQQDDLFQNVGVVDNPDILITGDQIEQPSSVIMYEDDNNLSFDMDDNPKIKTNRRM